MEKMQNVIDPPSRNDAVLSHSSPQQLEELLVTQCDSLDQTHEHPHMRPHRRAAERRISQHHPFPWQFEPWLRFRHRRCIRRGRWFLRVWQCLMVRHDDTQTAARVEPLLQPSTGGSLVVGGTPRVAALSAMVLPAAKRAAEIPATRVAGVREEPNPTLHTVRDTPLEMGMGRDDRIHRDLILPDQRFGAVVLVPVRPKREKLLDGNGKKTKVPVRMRIVFCTPSSYFIEAKASRGGPRSFDALPGKVATHADPHHPQTIIRPSGTLYPRHADSLRATA